MIFTGMLVIVAIIGIIYNMLKNKEVILTIFITIVSILITFIFNIRSFIFIATDEYMGGIFIDIFFWISFIIIISMIIFKMKYKLKTKNISFTLAILFMIILYLLSEVIFNYGGLIIPDKQDIIEAYINYLMILILQINLFINFISQRNMYSKEEKQKN